MFCIAASDGSSIRLKADPVECEGLLAQGEPYYVPPYVGARGWLGIQLDVGAVDWDEVAELIAVAYCLAAPKRLAKTVSSPPRVGG
jgi:predicted DNA-binding protein (MmcQ/YjbR family)